MTTPNRVPVIVNCSWSMYHGCRGVDIGQDPESTQRVRQVILEGRTKPFLFNDSHLTYPGAGS